MDEEFVVGTNTLDNVYRSAGVIFFLLFFYNFCIRDYIFINLDVALNLFTGRKMALGQRLYVDWIDNNPPAIYLFSEAIAFVSPFSPRLQGMLYYCCIMIVSALGFLLIRRSRKEINNEQLFLAVNLGYLVLATGGITDLISFGQREHLFALFFFPFLFWRLEKLRGSILHNAYWFGMAFFATMKPFFISLVLTVEVFNFLIRKRVDTVLWAIFAAGFMLPFVLLYLHSPDSIGGLFNTVLPFYLEDQSLPYTNSIKHFFVNLYVGKGFVYRSNGNITVASLATVPVVLWAAKKKKLLTAHAILFLILLLFANGSVLTQMKFYDYHFQLPATIVLFIICYTSGQYALGTKANDHSKLSITMVIALVGFMLGAANLYSAVKIFAVDKEKSSKNFNQITKQHDKILIVSTSALDILSHFQSGNVDRIGKWAYDFKLPHLIAIPDKEIRKQKLINYLKELRSEIDRAKPTLIMFSPNRQGLPIYETRPLHDILLEVYPELTAGYRGKIAYDAFFGWNFYYLEGPSR